MRTQRTRLGTVSRSPGARVGLKLGFAGYNDVTISPEPARLIDGGPPSRGKRRRLSLTLGV